MTEYYRKVLFGTTLIAGSSDQQNATVLYAVPSTDITKVIIGRRL